MNIREIFKKIRCGHKEYDVSLKKYTTYKLDTIARLIVTPKNINDLKVIITTIKNYNLDYKILGNGSNLIFVDDVYDGVLIKLSRFDDMSITGTKVVVGAGYNLTKLSIRTANESLTGLEFASGIPGTIGGAVYMNAGAGRNQISDYIERIEYYSPTKGTVEFIEKSNADFSYRHSIFQQNDWIILRIRFSLPSATYSEVEDRVKSRIKFANEKQAGNLPSCGSVFSQCNGHIMQLLMGLRIGGACWSKKTRNWISNLGGAKSKDICRLIGIARFLHIITLQKYSVEVRIWK